MHSSTNSIGDFTENNEASTGICKNNKCWTEKSRRSALLGLSICAAGCCGVSTYAPFYLCCSGGGAEVCGMFAALCLACSCFACCHIDVRKVEANDPCCLTVCGAFSFETHLPAANRERDYLGTDNPVYGATAPVQQRMEPISPTGR